MDRGRLSEPRAGGVSGGFAQMCHGKAAPLRRMQPGDWLVYYSPRMEIGEGEPLQAFTAIGRVMDDRVYEYAMSATFVPYRRNIAYVPARRRESRAYLIGWPSHAASGIGATPSVPATSG